MSIRDYTKRIFADALIEIMKATPLSKVRIGDICDRCGAQRQTFYYHFKDKYDLVAWIFEQDFVNALNQANGKYGIKHITTALKNIQNKKAFYKNAFSDKSQNSIEGYIHKYDVEVGENVLKNHLGVSELSPELSFAVKYHSYGCLGYTIEWLMENVTLTAEEFAKMQFDIMPDALKEAYVGK